MKIVTYNVNGLRPRISQFGSLRKLLDSFDADIICFQETKLSRHELRADMVRAEGYESFFSCTRTSEKGRTGYSGVATFCRVKSAFLSSEVALPLSAEEGFTGVLEKSPGLGPRRNGYQPTVEGLEDFSSDELLKVDGEGRCIITDHGHFVLFNVYGPRAQSDDTERIQFKRKFYDIMQKRWGSLLDQGRRIFVVGDLNIAPAAIDRCDAGPEFEKDQFRIWFRSLLVQNGGSFVDVFREKHPERREAYTCWATNSGAEEFNFGARIDHVLCAGPCLHIEENKDHSLVTCHVKECDILEQFKRWKPGNKPRWKGGRNVKLEGSDHAPVFVNLEEIPSIQEHNTPSLSIRYCPQVYGCQQTLVSLLTKRQTAEQIDFTGGSSSNSDYSIVAESCSQIMKQSLHAHCSSSSDEGTSFISDDCSKGGCGQLSNKSAHTELDCPGSVSSSICNKKTRRNQLSQLSLKSFFQKAAGVGGNLNRCSADKSIDQGLSDPSCVSNKILYEGGEDDVGKESQRRQCAPLEEESASQPSEKESKSSALAEWQRIQQLMQTSIPLCKGHKEPCVARVVKKAGPNVGRRFYVCARAEGPSSNSEANCGFFKWATSKSKGK